MRWLCFLLGHKMRPWEHNTLICMRCALEIEEVVRLPALQFTGRRSYANWLKRIGIE